MKTKLMTSVAVLAAVLGTASIAAAQDTTTVTDSFNIVPTLAIADSGNDNSSVADSGNDNSTTDVALTDSFNDNSVADSGNDNSTMTDSGNDNSVDLGVDVADSFNDNSVADSGNDESIDVALTDSLNDSSVNDSNNDNSTNTDASTNLDVALTDSFNDNSVNDSNNDNSTNTDASTNLDVAVTDSFNDNSTNTDSSLTYVALSSQDLGASVSNVAFGLGGEGDSEQNGDINTGAIVAEGGAYAAFAGIQTVSNTTGLGSVGQAATAVTANANVSFGGQ